MNRREFHKAAMASLVAVATPRSGAEDQSAAGDPISPLPHPGDSLPPGATARFGTTRFWHFAECGNEGLNDLAFSPDGRTLAALGYQDGCISLWEVPSGRMLRKWDADKADRCGELAFSPCGRFLACGSNDGVRLWDPSTGQLDRQFADDRTPARGVAFSPDGRLLAAAIEFGGRVDVWEVATGELLTSFEGDPHPICPDQAWEKWDRFQSVAFSPDGLLVAAGSHYDLFHELDQAETGSVKAQEQQVMEIAQLFIQGDRETASQRMASLQGRHHLHQELLKKYGSATVRGWNDKYYAAEPRGRVWCWELATGKCVAKLEGHDFPVERVSFTRDGRPVSCADDGTVWLWNVYTGQKGRELGQSHNKAFQTSAAFASDGCHALFSRPGSLALMNLTDGIEVRRFPVRPDWGGWHNLALSADARWAATDTRGCISLWDGSTGRDASPPGRHSGWHYTLRFTADSRYVVTTTDSEAFLWEAETGQLLRQVGFDGYLSVPDLALSPDGRQAACVLRQYRLPSQPADFTSLVTWDWRSGDVWHWKDVSPTALAWTADGESVLVGTAQGEVFALYLPTGRCEQYLDGVTDGVLDVVASADGRLAAALGKGPEVHVWHLTAGRRRHRLDVPPHPRPEDHKFLPVGRLSFSPDNRQVALTRDGYVYVGLAEGRQLTLVFTAPRIPNVLNWFTTGFLASGRLLAAGSLGADDKEGGPPYTIWVWDVATGRRVWESPPQRFPISPLAISPDGQKLASSDSAISAVLWDLGSLG